MDGKMLTTLTAAPHRAWFLLGLISAGLSVLWWLAWLVSMVQGAPLALAQGLVPAHAHGLVMSHGMLSFFFFGFLSTVFPNWQGQPAIPRPVWLRAWLCAVVGYPLTLLGFATATPVLVVGVLFLALGHALATLSMVAVYRDAGADRVGHAAMSLIALAGGQVSLLLFAAGVALGDTTLAGIAVRASIWLYVLPVFATVAHRMVPFFSRSVIDDFRSRRPWWPLILIFVGSAGHLLADEADLAAWRFLPDLLAAFGAGWLSLRWQPWRCLRPPLMASLHLGFAWIPIALLLSAVQSVALLSTGQLWLARAPLHALVIGGFSTLLLAMVTRVSLGHSGRPLVMPPATWALVWAMQAVALVRIAGELPLPGTSRWVVNAAAAGLWLAIVAAWGIVYGPMYLRPRVDGKPG